MGREGRSRQSLGVQRGRGGPGSGRGQWQYCTYVRVGGHRVITLDGVGLPTSQDHWPTNLGFGAIRDRGTFGRGLKQKETHRRVRIHKLISSSTTLSNLWCRDQKALGYGPTRRGSVNLNKCMRSSGTGFQYNGTSSSLRIDQRHSTLTANSCRCCDRTGERFCSCLLPRLIAQAIVNFGLIDSFNESRTSQI